MVRYLLVKSASHMYGRVLKHSDPIKTFDNVKDARAYAATHSKDGYGFMIIKETKSSKTVIGYVVFSYSEHPIMKNGYVVSPAYFKDLGPYYQIIYPNGNLGKKEL